MPTQGNRIVATGIVAVALTVCAVVTLVPNVAWAGAAVSTQPDSPRSGQTITVSGTGFPARTKIPTGIQIIECADPGGTVSNLPTSALLCDGTTQNPSQINTDASGNFSTKYTVSALNGTHTSNIWCDRTHYCVLWVGVDYNQSFYGVHAFSAPFRVGGAGPGASGAGGLLWIPIVVVVLATALFVLRARARRRMLSSR